MAGGGSLVVDFYGETAGGHDFFGGAEQDANTTAVTPCCSAGAVDVGIC